MDSIIQTYPISQFCFSFQKPKNEFDRNLPTYIYFSDTNYTNKNNNKNPRHIYHGVGKTILEDISDDEDEDNIQENDHPSEDQLHHLKKTEQQQQISNKKVEEELSRLQNALDRAKNSIAFLKERERKLKDR